MTQAEVQAAVRYFGSFRAAAKVLGVSKTHLNDLANGKKKASRSINRTLENNLASLNKSAHKTIEDGGRMLKHLSPDQWKKLNKGKWYDRKTGTYKGKQLDQQQTQFQGFKRTVDKWRRQGEKYPPREMYQDIYGDSPKVRKPRRPYSTRPRTPGRTSRARGKGGFDW